MREFSKLVCRRNKAFATAMNAAAYIRAYNCDEQLNARGLAKAIRSPEGWTAKIVTASEEIYILHCRKWDGKYRLYAAYVA